MASQMRRGSACADVDDRRQKHRRRGETRPGTRVNFADVHFLRPRWLLALIPPAALVAWLLYKRRGTSSWERVIEPRFLETLVVDAGNRPSRGPLIVLALGWLLTVLALAGPTWT
jgi:hypothetical protein